MEAQMTKMTARQNAQYYYMMDAMRRFEWDMHTKIEQSGRIPQEWHEIAKMPDSRPKRQVNIGLEEDVLKFFRSMGRGYGDRINTILRSFMHARLAGVVEGGETLNLYKTWEAEFDDPKPEFGYFAEQLGQDWEDATGEDTRQKRKERMSAILRRAAMRRDGA
jgi:uncharacterized protein (DUF4415 family)